MLSQVLEFENQKLEPQKQTQRDRRLERASNFTNAHSLTTYCSRMSSA